MCCGGSCRLADHWHESSQAIIGVYNNGQSRTNLSPAPLKAHVYSPQIGTPTARDKEVTTYREYIR